MDRKIAFLFPGQGAQAPGMGAAFYQASPAARQAFDLAQESMPGIKEVCFSGSMEDLTRTQVAQPALFVTNLACAMAAQEKGVTPHAVCGFSLGEWSAVAFSGMLAFSAAFSLVRKRGQWMQECAQREPGGMSAVLRLSANQVMAALKPHNRVYAVNFNAPGQTVVAGPTDDLAAFENDLKQAGGRAMRLNVSGPFHSPYMQDAAQKLLNALREVELKAPLMPVIANRTGQAYDLSLARETLAAQADHPVRFVDSVLTLDALGITDYVEVGPGQVLSGLVKKILPAARTHAVSSPPELDTLLLDLQGEQHAQP